MSLRISRFSITVLSLIGGVIVLAGCGQSASASSATTPTPEMQMTMVPPTPGPAATSASARPGRANGPQVVIDNVTFGPQTLMVKAGTTVTWVNHDDTAHTVTSVDKVFGSNALDTGDQISYEFKTPGTYKYYCTIHPQMTGTVVVQ